MRLRQSAAKSLSALALAAALASPALADTIRLRDGTTVRGQIIAYKDQQFTVLIGAGTRGRRSRMTVYMEDVESIEFDNPFGAADGGGNNSGTRTGGDEAVYDEQDASAGQQRPQPQSQPGASRPAPQTQPRTQPADAGTQRAGGAPVFFPIRLRVDPKSTDSGWVSSGFTVRRGQRLRVTASGRISLSNGLSTTPTGLPRVNDTDKLMPNQPTGALIGVIGDDNNDFLLLSSGQEIISPRDGILFLGINTGRLTTTGGAYEVVIEAEVTR
jgi:hypothetical protein